MIPESTEPILQYVMKLYEEHAGRSQTRPLLVGLNGPLGSGKTTIASHVAARLKESNIKVVAFSIDDMYLTRSEQVALAETTQNKLLAHRGLPGTHDVELCTTVLESLINQKPARVPIYDKSAFHGQGDRSSESVAVEPPYHVVLLEGWCVGFSSLSEEDAYNRWRHSIEVCYEDTPGILGTYSFDDVCYVNSLLRAYDAIWYKLDALIHLEEHNMDDPYDWKKQEEHDLIKRRGMGMSDKQVSQFMDAFIAAYVLFFETVEEYRTLVIKLDSQRHVVKVTPQLEPPSWAEGMPIWSGWFEL